MTNDGYVLASDPPELADEIGPLFREARSSIAWLIRDGATGVVSELASGTSIEVETERPRTPFNGGVLPTAEPSKLSHAVAKFGKSIFRRQKGVGETAEQFGITGKR